MAPDWGEAFQISWICRARLSHICLLSFLPGHKVFFHHRELTYYFIFWSIQKGVLPLITKLQLFTQCHSLEKLSLMDFCKAILFCCFWIHSIPTEQPDGVGGWEAPQDDLGVISVLPSLERSFWHALRPSIVSIIDEVSGLRFFQTTAGLNLENILCGILWEENWFWSNQGWDF